MLLFSDIFITHNPFYNGTLQPLAQPCQEVAHDEEDHQNVRIDLQRIGVLGKQQLRTAQNIHTTDGGRHRRALDRMTIWPIRAGIVTSMT